MKQTLPSLRSQGLLLRPIEETDLPNIYRGLSHPEVIRYYGVSYDSLEATKTQMEWFAAATQCWWAICSPDDTNLFYGAAGLNDICTEHQKAEIGLWLLPPYWGQGILTTVLPLICDYGFNQLQLRRIEGFVEAENTNCHRAMAKLDFQHQGRIVDGEIKNGQRIQVDIYAKLSPSEKK